MNPTIPTIDWISILPVTIVVFAGIVGLLIEAARPEAQNGPIMTVTLVGLILAGVAVILGLPKPESDTFAGMLHHDVFGSAIMLVLILAAILSTLFSDAYLRDKRIAFGEFYPLMLWSGAGAMIMATSRNLLVIFIGLEVMSIGFYVLTGLSRSEEKSEEAAMKYFLLGAFASGFLLYGMAFFYGATDGLRLDALPVVLAGPHGMVMPLLGGGLALMLVGLGFKCGFVPFHQWTPDVYQGAPTNVTAFMAAVAKLGGFAALWRLLDAFSPLQAIWFPPLFWIAVLTMTVGNLIALVQRDVKRTLGYSSISHGGYLLVALLAHAVDPHRIGDFTVLYYLLGYSVMTLGAFAVVSLTAEDGKEGTRLENLRGLMQRSPFAAVCLVVFMMSLVGLPPTVGFVGKLLIFNDALSAGLTSLAVVLAVNSAISSYYYLGIAWAALTRSDAEAAPRPVSVGARLTCALCVLAVFASALLVSPLQSAATQRTESVLVQR